MTEFKEVTQEEFYATVGQMNVNPHSERNHTDWVEQYTRKLLGKSEPGYVFPGAPKRYWVAEEGVRS